MLLGVTKIFDFMDLESSILLDERKDANGIVVDRGAISSSKYNCHLCRDWFKATRRLRREHTRE